MNNNNYMGVYLCSVSNCMTCGTNRDKCMEPLESSYSVADMISMISASVGTHPGNQKIDLQMSNNWSTHA